MSGALPPFLFIADRRGSWDSWRFAVELFGRLEAAGEPGTFILAGGESLPAGVSTRRAFALETVSGPVGSVMRRALRSRVPPEVSLVHAFGAGVAGAARSLARELDCRWCVSVFRYGEPLGRRDAEDERCFAVFAEDSEHAASLGRSLPQVREKTAAMPLASAARRGAEALSGPTPALASMGPGEGPALVRVVEAAALLRERGAHFQLFLQPAGGEGKLRRMVRERELGAAVTFLDEAVHYARAACGADVLVMAGGRREATLPVLAALSAGRVAVVRDAEGLRDVAAGGEGVVELSGEDDAGPEVLADRVEELLGDPELRRRLGASAAETLARARPFAATVGNLVEAYSKAV